VEGVAVHAPLPSAPADGGGRLRALLFHPGSSADDAADAVRARGGRVLVLFGSSAAVIRIAPGEIDALCRDLPGARVATGPVEEPGMGALAPEAAGWWNRSFGLPDPVEPAGARSMNHSPGQAGHGHSLDPSISLPAALDASARAAMKSFIECLAAPATDGGCLDGLLDPDAQAGLRAMAMKEAAVARAEGFRAADFTFALLAFDGRLARYEVRREGHPTGAITLVLRGDAWVISEIDP
jgi:hypothetical protein